MARAALGLSIIDLGKAAGVRAATVSNFESGGDAYASTIAKLQTALETRGVAFVGDGEASLNGGEGVRLRL
ncbi:helix-turn-helix domain-containing protein [Sphingomonas sp. Leaf357]|uniref:helix-turn-helix domain-containing protein n=1 Tax=Sphingomonas sp. Leaf357 TaxID=1736350 RepID=UPI001F3019A3|nr:helix-turn-helix transcriptional regulator [Sphingomonas sp. Leaf357]